MWSIQLFPHALHPRLSPLYSLDKTHIVVHADIVMPIFLTLPYKSRLCIECKVFTCSKTVEKAAQFIPDSSEHGVLPTRLSALQKLPWWLVQCWKTLIFPPSSTVSQLYFGASVCEDHLHGLLCVRLGHFPLLLTAERRRNRRRRSGMDVSRQEGRSWNGGDRLLGADGHSAGLRCADPEETTEMVLQMCVHYWRPRDSARCFGMQFPF